MSRFRDGEAHTLEVATGAVTGTSTTAGLLRRIVRTRGTDDDVVTGSCRLEVDRTDDAVEEVELSPAEELDEFSKSLAELLMDWWKPSEEEDVEQGDAATGMLAADCGR